MIVEFFNGDSKFDGILTLDTDFLLRKQFYIVDECSVSRILVGNVELESVRIADGEYLSRTIFKSCVDARNNGIVKVSVFCALFETRVGVFTLTAKDDGITVPEGDDSSSVYCDTEILEGDD